MQYRYLPSIVYVDDMFSGKKFLFYISCVCRFCIKASRTIAARTRAKETNENIASAMLTRAKQTNENIAIFSTKSGQQKLQF